MRLNQRRLYLARGRLVVYVEPRDGWVGFYLADAHLYVCPVPFVVLRFARGAW